MARKRYDVDMSVFRYPEEERRKRVKDIFTSLDAKSKVDLINSMFDDLETNVRRNREMLRRLFIELDKHPDYFSDEVDRLKYDLEHYENKLRAASGRLNHVKHQKSRLEMHLKIIGRQPPSPIKEHKLKALRKDVQGLDNLKRDLETRVRELNGRVLDIRNRLGV